MPPNGVIFSDFMLTFAVSLKILLVLICSTKISEKSDMATYWSTFCCPVCYKVNSSVHDKKLKT